MTEIVYQLYHTHQTPNGDEDKLIGYYSTETDAQTAIGRLVKQPGFETFFDGFLIEPYQLDKQLWKSGFVDAPPRGIDESRRGLAMIDTVYRLSHEIEYPDYVDVYRELGVFSSQAAAETARDRARLLPGFSNHPDGFHIGAYKLNKDHWKEGFFIYEPPS